VGFGARRLVVHCSACDHGILKGVRDYSENIRTQMRKSAHGICYDCYKWLALDFRKGFDHSSGEPFIPKEANSTIISLWQPNFTPSQAR
jgi:hypothetical protein